MPRYLTEGFHVIGSLLKVNVSGIGVRRRLNNILTLFDGLIDIFLFFSSSVVLQWFCRFTYIASG
jgi:hypothetical protein